MYDTLSDNFKKIVDDQREEYDRLTEVPPYIFQRVWYSFWEIKSCHTIENPINHTAIKDFIELMDIKLNPWEVRQILSWDGDYYQYYQKHKDT